MKRITVVATILVSTIPVVASTGPAENTALETNKTAAEAIAASDKQIVPGLRIGPLRLSANTRELENLLGKPLAGGPGLMAAPGSVRYMWNALGVWTIGDAETGNVLWISIEANDLLNWTEFATKGGVRIGSPEAGVRSVFGKPERVVSALGLHSLYFDRQGIRFTIAESGRYAGRVSGLRVIWPVILKGDGIIAPGERISLASLNGAVADLLTRLGGGYTRTVLENGDQQFFWPHLNLAVLARDGHVSTVRYASIYSEGIVVPYKTKEGLSIGTAVDAVQAAFGSPDRSDSMVTPAGKNLKVLVFDGRGIAFLADETQQIETIDVFLRGKGSSAPNYSPRTAADYITRGDTYAKHGDLDRAITDFNEAVRLDPKLAAAYAVRAAAYNAKGDFDRALADANTAIGLNDHNALAYFVRGNVRGARGEIDQAIADLTVATRLDGQLIEAYWKLCNAYFVKRDLDSVIAVASEAIAGPGCAKYSCAPIYNYRAMAYGAKRHPDLAVADYTAALEIDPTDVRSRNGRASALEDKGHFERAIEDHDQLIRMQPGNAQWWNNRCWARAVTDQLQSALADCNEALRLRPNDPSSLDSRGFTYLKLGQFDKSIADYDARLRGDSRAASSLYGRGVARFRKGDVSAGRSDIGAAKAIQGDIAAEFARYGVDEPK